MAKACIICAKTVAQGRPVEDDAVISGIRAVKQKLGIAKNNELVVCPGCIEAYKKRRGEYEKRLVQHVVIAAIVFLVFAFLPLFTTGFSLWSLLLGVIFAAGVLLLSVFSHCPKMKETAQEKAASEASQAGGLLQKIKIPSPKKAQGQKKKGRK